MSYLQQGPYNKTVATDNCTAFNDLLSAGGTIAIQDGVYHIQMPENQKSFIISSNGTSLIGQDNATLVFHRGGSGNLYSITAEMKNDITFRNLTLQGTPTVADYTVGPAFYGCSDILIDDCIFQFFYVNLYIGRAQTPAGAWILGNPLTPNCQGSVAALLKLSSANVTIRRNIFRPAYQDGNHIAVFGGSAITITDNVFLFDQDTQAWPLDRPSWKDDRGINPDTVGGGIAILCDDASQATKIEFYSINDDVKVFCNYAPHGDMRLDGTASGRIANNRFRRIEVRSYDLDQQALNFPAPASALVNRFFG